MDTPASTLDKLDGSRVLHALGALAIDLQDFIADPHLPVADGRSVLSEPQHVQVHVVFSASPQAKAKAFVVSLQVHRVELSILS